MTAVRMDGAPAALITSVQRGLRLLEAASSVPEGAHAKQLARKVGLPIGTTYHLLRTLTFEGYLHRLAGGGYVLGDQVGRLLEQGEFQGLLRRARPALSFLRDAAHAPAYLAFYEDGEIVIKDIQDSPHIPRIDLWVGFRDAAHATALGRCVLALLDPRDLRDYLARHRLDDLTDRTITNRQMLLQALDRARLAGLVVEDGEYLPGYACVAVAIRAGSLLGAVGLSLPRRRLSELERIVPVLRSAADRIARACATGV